MKVALVGGVSFFQCEKQTISVKSIARRPWEECTKTYNTYLYEPLDTQEAAAHHLKARPSEGEMTAIVEGVAIQPIWAQ